MPYSDSRYAQGLFFKSNDPRTYTNQVGVLRQFPVLSGDYYYYTWVEGDRIDTVAFNLYNDPEMWWTIMDANPEIIDPQNIAPGTNLRIPNV